MIERTHDTRYIKECTQPYRDEMFGFYPEAWSLDERNIALKNDSGDLSLFEYEIPGVITGHMFFVSRGREALRVFKQMIDFIFNTTDAEVIRGLTPLRKKAARWITRQGGFTSYGAIKTAVEPCELFILTRQEWDNRRNTQ